MPIRNPVKKYLNIFETGRYDPLGQYRKMMNLFSEKKVSQKSVKNDETFVESIFAVIKKNFKKYSENNAWEGDSSFSYYI